MLNFPVAYISIDGFDFSLDATGFSVWSPWSVCNVECSFGESTRDRTCTDETRETCNGTSSQNVACDAGSCPSKI